MKKLMTVLASAALAFGLYAEDAVLKDGTSFESGELGVVAGDPATFDVDATTDWTFEGEDPLEIGEYAVGEELPYGTPEKNVRWDEKFPQDKTNDNYLNLDTGTEKLTRTIGAGNLVVDQLVKFSGFDEVQTNFVDATKIAVWMSDIEKDGEPNETNLYVTAGTTIGDADQTAIKIDGNDWELQKWYRLTIKSIGDIYKEEYTGDHRAGFVVYVNGDKVASDAAKAIIADDTFLTPAAAKLYAQGQLFPAIDTTDTDLNEVSYAGTGAIDDIAADIKGPAFAIDEYGFTITPPTGLRVIGVVDKNGTALDLADLKVVPDNNPVTITFAAEAGYKITGDTTLEKTIAADGDVIEIGDDEIEYDLAAVQVVNDDQTVTNLYVEAELGTVLTGLKTGDTATVLQNCAILNEKEETLISFTKNTTVAVPEANAWDIFIANVDTTTAGALVDNVGLFADKTVNVAFSEQIDEYNVCMLSIFGAIDGDITADNKGIVSINTDGNEGCELLGTVTAANVQVGGDVTFVGGGKIVSQTDLTSFEEYFLPEGAVEITEDEGTFTAQIKAPDYVAQIGAKKYETLNEAFAEAKTGDTIEMLANVTLSERIFIGSGDGNKDITLELAGKAITWDASVANASGVLIVRSGSKLTVADSSGTNAGKIDANGKAYAAIAITHSTYQDDTKTASLIVNGGTLVGFYQGIAGNGDRPNTYVEINDGVITATAADTNLAIFNPQKDSTVVINDGEITGLDSAIEMRGGTLTVNGGTLTATAEEYAVKPNGSGSTTKGAAVAVSQHTTKGDIAVEIKGGTLKGLNAVSVANPQGNATDNVAVTLGAGATYNGALAFSADGNATVTNNGADLDAPEGYKWDNGVLTKIEYATLKITAGENVTAVVVTNAAGVVVTEETKFDKDDAVVVAVDLSQTTFAENYELDAAQSTLTVTLSADDEIIVKAKEKQQGGWDVPSGDEDKPAQEVWETIPDNLADVPAGKLSTWAKANDVPFGGEFTETMSDAYLLDCAPTEEKVAEEKAKINIASIEFKDGDWVITTVSEDKAGDEFGNGKLELVDVTKDVTGAEGSDAAKLWKMKLVPITATK